LQPFNHLTGVTIIDFAKDGVLDGIYLEYYAVLLRYAYTFLHDQVLAEEMVHQVFLKALEKKEPLTIHTSIKAYLYRAVYNECLNYIKHQRIKSEFEEHSLKSMNQYAETPSVQLQFSELEKQLSKAINELPEQCRIIFQLSRFEELKYTEIAAQLGLSVKTVETQMSRALKKLRVQLADYLPLIIGILLTIATLLIHRYEY
jgi:RNA polymerase sigma-70 factor (ECF subfamily)